MLKDGNQCIGIANGRLVRHCPAWDCSVHNEGWRRATLTERGFSSFRSETDKLVLVGFERPAVRQLHSVTMFRGKQEQGNVQLNSKHYYSFKLFLFNTSLILCGNFDCLHVQKATSALSLGQRHADPILPLYVCGVEVFYLQNTEYFIDPVTGNYSVNMLFVFRLLTDTPSCKSETERGPECSCRIFCLLTPPFEDVFMLLNVHGGGMTY